MAQRRAQQRVREVLLLRRHFLERKSLSFARNEMPVETLIVVQRVTGFGGLFGCQRCQKIVGGRGHLIGHELGVSGGMRPGRKNGQLRKQNEGWKASGGFHAAKSMPVAEKRKPKMRSET